MQCFVIQFIYIYYNQDSCCSDENGWDDNYKVKVHLHRPTVVACARVCRGGGIVCVSLWSWVWYSAQARAGWMLCVCVCTLYKFCWLRKTVCSPLLVRYRAIEMTTIIILFLVLLFVCLFVCLRVFACFLVRMNFYRLSPSLNHVDESVFMVHYWHSRTSCEGWYQNSTLTECFGLKMYVWKSEV